jgi:hypothetical protein
MARWKEVTWRRWCVKIGLLISSASVLYLAYILPAHSRHMQWPSAGQWELFFVGFGLGSAIYFAGWTWDDPYRRK